MKKILDKKGNIKELPALFQILMIAIVIAGLVFIVSDKFKATTVTDSLVTGTVQGEAVTAASFTNGTGWTLVKSTTEPYFRSPSIVAVYNNTNVLLTSGNYTLTGNVLKNATALAGLANVKVNYTYSYVGSGLSSYKVINSTEQDLYDYGIGFLGIIILVTMVYLIIRIVSGSGRKN